MKRLLTYGLLLLTILASHFVVSACQDDLPETTEVMVTFTTRAFVNAEETGDDSDAIDEEKMKDLRVIMLDGDNDVVGNALKQNIGTNSVMFKFQTPVTIGEEFKFLAIANENSLGLQDQLNAIQTTLSDYENSWKNRVVTNSISPTAKTPLPQTKFWTWTYGVDEEDSDKLNPTLDYIASKISVEFKNETNKAQTLKNIKLTGFGSATQGYLFMQDNDFTGQQGVQDITLVGDEGLTIPFEQNNLVKYYTYPVSTVSSPKLVATWNNVTKDLDLSKVTSLPRNQHLKILVTLTDVGIEVTYEIAGWKENTTTIGGVNPTIGDSYVVGGWETNDEEDVVIGEEPVKPDPGTGGEVTVWGDKDGEGAQEINWEKGKNLVVDLDWLENAASVTGPKPESGIGIQMYVYFTGNGGKMEIRKGTTTDSYSSLYINGTKTSYLDSMGSERVSIFIPNEVIDTQFNFSGINYTITKITVVK